MSTYKSRVIQVSGRLLASFSDEIYAQRAKEAELFRKTMDIAKLWVSENDNQVMQGCRGFESSEHTPDNAPNLVVRTAGVRISPRTKPGSAPKVIK